MPAERKRRDRPKMNGEYDVGCGKPPKEHRFQAGYSGNPAGGRKKARNFDSSRLGDLVERRPHGLRDLSHCEQHLRLRASRRRAGRKTASDEIRLIP
jgi:hypothetical protein